MRIALVVAGRPSLWLTALRQWKALTPPRWWARRPFLPVPSPEYLEFRMITQYGDIDHRPPAGDVLNYLAWCHAQRAAA
jgi:hypothetical protein